MLLTWLTLVILEITNADSSPDCPTDDKKSDVCQVNSIKKLAAETYLQGDVIHIDCNKPALDQNVIPVTNFSSFEKLAISECSVPSGGFKNITDRFNVKNLKFLRYEKSDNIMIHTDCLKGIDSLEKLELPMNHIKFINSSFFTYVPNLTSLNLESNEIELTENVFQYSNQLRFLSIKQNKLKNIPKHTFSGLIRLRELILSKNDLSDFEDGTFDALESLEMLILSENKLSRLTTKAFSKLTNLKEINLNNNQLLSFSRDYLANCMQLNFIYISGNQNMSLENWAFSNFTSLEKIDLSSVGLTDIPEFVFHGSINLREISLKQNKLRTLSRNIFGSQERLTILYLNDNEIVNLESGTFETLKSVAVLHLGNNNLTIIQRDLLRNLEKLERLNVSYNNIRKIENMALSDNSLLRILMISHNKLNFENESESNWLGSKRHLISLDLSYNRLTRCPYQLSFYEQMRELVLEYNSIGSIEVDRLNDNIKMSMYVNLQHNNISYIDIGYKRRDASLTLEISGNPLLCDCHTIDLTKHLQNQNNDKKIVISTYGELNCAGPEELKGVKLEEVSLENLTCTLEKSCTRENICDCKYRAVDKTIVINCGKKNLTSIPDIVLSHRNLNEYDFEKTEVHLEDNYLKEFSDQYDKFNDTTKLFLGGNKIESITWLPEGLEVLDLENNNLKSLNESFLKMLEYSSIMTINLGRNPWDCGCAMKNFTKYLRNSTHKIPDVQNVRCNRTGRKLIDLNEKDLCPAGADITKSILLATCLCLFMITALVILYFLHRKNILVWLYGRGLCLWLIEEENLDNDRIYDAFICYSHKDSNFVENNLVKVLEEGDRPYKLCVHVRDWICGELIQTQIITSVRDSKRTVIVLSSHFNDSDWGIMEFRTAHSESLQEKRFRVIVIIYGEIDMGSLDEELKAYLKTNTYIKWGDPWFWDKLKYALPRTKKIMKSQQKHENIVSSIDKFELDAKRGNSASNQNPRIIFESE